MYILGVGVDVGQKPVAQNVSFDAEGKFQLSILLDVHQLSLGILLSSSGAPEDVGVLNIRGLSSGVLCFDRELKDAGSTLESLDRVDQVTLTESRRGRDLALVERAAEGEDVAILVNVDVEVGVVDVQTIGGLFEVLNKNNGQRTFLDDKGIAILTT
jgi:hypothetical protein